MQVSTTRCKRCGLCPAWRLYLFSGIQSNRTPDYVQSTLTFYMFNFSKISTNLIVVSLISSVMVLWLGTKYISDAHQRFSGAIQLQRSVTPETTLFEIAQNLNLERGAIQKALVSSDRYEEQLDYLKEVTQQTQQLFSRVKTELRESRPRNSEKIQFQYSDSIIDDLIMDLDDRLARVPITATIISSQVYLAPERREEGVRLKLFDTYTNLIVAVNKLREKSHALSEKNYTGVLSTHDAKDSIWAVSEAIHQTNSLLRSYSRKSELSLLDSINTENLTLRLIQQRENADQALTDLSFIVKGAFIDTQLANAITELTEYYEGDYRDYLRAYNAAIRRYAKPALSLEESEAVTLEINRRIQTLTHSALSSTLERADSISHDATKTLAINSLLVLLCMVMAYGSFQVSKKVQHQADYDDLTGIANRRKFSSTLNFMLRKSDVSNNQKLALTTIDLNGFKTINDTMGHSVGDKLLIGVTQRLKNILSNRMTLARLGGDEFAIIFTTENSKEIHQLASKIPDVFTNPFEIDESKISIDASVGYSIYPDDASTAEELQTTSDFAMFNAKQSKDKKIQPYNHEMASQFENRITVEKDLASAIDKNELELYYQPQFNLDLNQVNAVEALIRWNHPTRGIVPPDEFIGIAEETGLMPAIGDWVLNEACRQAALWNSEEQNTIRVAVNVSIHQIMQPGFVDNVLTTINHHNVSPDSLELEITESVVINDISWIIKSLQTLKNKGLKIALDDFGTGYSSLSQLQALPLDTLKIDQSFICNIDDDDGNMRSVTETITSIADIYGLETVAEGVESNEQLRAVNKLGINVVQGYYYSRPLPRDEVTDVISTINAEAREKAESKYRNAA